MGLQQNSNKTSRHALQIQVIYVASTWLTKVPTLKDRKIFFYHIVTSDNKKKVKAIWFLSTLPKKPNEVTYFYWEHKL